MNSKTNNQNPQVWYHLANLLIFLFLLLAFCPIGLDIISLIVYTIDSPNLEDQNQKRDAKKAILTISLLSVMHIINFIICYMATQKEKEVSQKEQAKFFRIQRILNHLSQFLTERVNLLKTQCYFVGACLPILIALSFRFQIFGKYEITDNIYRIIQFHALNLITTCGFYFYLLTLIFFLNLNELYQLGKSGIFFLLCFFIIINQSLGIKNIIFSFLFIYSCGMMDFGLRNQFAFSEQILETQISNGIEQELILFSRSSSDNSGKSFNLFMKAEFGDLKFQD